MHGHLRRVLLACHRWRRIAVVGLSAPVSLDRPAPLGLAICLPLRTARPLPTPSLRGAPGAPRHSSRGHHLRSAPHRPSPQSTPGLLVRSRGGANRNGPRTQPGFTPLAGHRFSLPPGSSHRPSLPQLWRPDPDHRQLDAKTGAHRASPPGTARPGFGRNPDPHSDGVRKPYRRLLLRSTAPRRPTSRLRNRS